MSEKMYKECSINPIDIIEEYCEQVPAMQVMLDELEGWGTSQAGDFAELLNLKCESENTYNNPDLTYHLNNVIQWHILSAKKDSFYDENAFLLVEAHGGGDVRGNYNAMRVYKFKNGSTLGDLYCSLYVDSEDVDIEED